MLMRHTSQYKGWIIAVTVIQRTAYFVERVEVVAPGEASDESSGAVLAMDRMHAYDTEARAVEVGRARARRFIDQRQP